MESLIFKKPISKMSLAVIYGNITYKAIASVIRANVVFINVFFFKRKAY